jgi:Ca-activated chloride channel family protein
MRRAIILVCISLVSTHSLNQLVQAQQRQPPISKVTEKSSATPVQPSSEQQVSDGDVVRVNSNLVTIPASVMDRDGRYITDLRKEDFQIFEDGVEQDVQFFAPVEQPFTILFLLDTSGSMRYRMEDLANAANAFIKQLRPDDQLIVASFSDTVRVLCKATMVKQIQEEGVKFRLHAGGGTQLYDAISDAIKRMKKIKGRKAIVLFSDGLGGGIFAILKSTLRNTEEQDALIYAVQFGSLPAEPPRSMNKRDYFELLQWVNSYMRDLAQKTGGRHFHIESISDLERTFGLVADELRRQYSLGYYPKKQLAAGQRREIKVEVRLPNLAVRARDSYIVQLSKNR